ncbi:unnamed protein product [Hymenolepis diminuta]|uniref:CN hydrolase domain-containing protein n=1 Tax=Hymenolepis diminuta TaxID=6216 RepID=A0A0R3SX03_HYMDI|nr:unnamed protein product [Hymenolepis diminuta]VUZ49870.1 unnamed protein product [Hymenolepis diminuta]
MGYVTRSRIYQRLNQNVVNIWPSTLTAVRIIAHVIIPKKKASEPVKSHNRSVLIVGDPVFASDLRIGHSLMAKTVVERWEKPPMNFRVWSEYGDSLVTNQTISLDRDRGIANFTGTPICEEEKS